ncbi:MAG: methylmalonyl Co-A mutase-associated GTPase MeaB [Myxococcales bacterium]|nr:methylmalonyl Co-A mutase-associated GTPase MeaB [Myxococcales bacterium]
MARPTLTTEQYVAGVAAGERSILARAITLVESARADHQAQARAVLAALAPRTGGAWRVGITGVPGVGKSTFIEALGTRLTAQGRRVAVLAVDPSSALSGGSILGDKTRMTRLSVDPLAFVRPSPTSGTLGGVARKTRESLLLCEAAGFDVVLVETVGVGQSETAVAGMTDFFLALMLPGAGDELQGIKRGVLELADAIAVNKADGDNVARAGRAAQGYRNALHYLKPRHPWWATRVLTCSAATGDKLDRVWQAVAEHRAALEAEGRLETRRRQQDLTWLEGQLDEGLRALLGQGAAQAAVQAARAQVAAGALPATVAAAQVLEGLRLAFVPVDAGASADR